MGVICRGHRPRRPVVGADDPVRPYLSLQRLHERPERRGDGLFLPRRRVRPQPVPLTIALHRQHPAGHVPAPVGELMDSVDAPPPLRYPQTPFRQLMRRRLLVQRPRHMGELPQTRQKPLLGSLPPRSISA